MAENPEPGGSRRQSSPPTWRAARRTHCADGTKATATAPSRQHAARSTKTQGSADGWLPLPLYRARAHLKTITMSRWARFDTGQSSARLVLFEMSRHPSIAEKPSSPQAAPPQAAPPPTAASRPRPRHSPPRSSCAPSYAPPLHHTAAPLQRSAAPPRHHTTTTPLQRHTAAPRAESRFKCDPVRVQLGPRTFRARHGDPVRVQIGWAVSADVQRAEVAILVNGGEQVGDPGTGSRYSRGWGL